MKGKLYLVSTPIGNLEDITFRAVKILEEVDLIAAEDTRHSIKLLNHFNIKKSMISYFEHNKIEKGLEIIKHILQGENVALITDAGTPGISDPGEELVSLAYENSIEVVPIPGPVAAIAGLISSGLSTSRFVFEGFLSTNKRVRKERLNKLLNEERTIIFYEAPHKLKQTLNDLYCAFGDRRLTFARELTKKYEEIIRSTIKECIERFDNIDPKGEFVLVLEGNLEKEENKEDKTIDEEEILIELKKLIKSGYSKKDAIKLISIERNIKKRNVFEISLKLDE